MEYREDKRAVSDYLHNCANRVFLLQQVLLIKYNGFSI